ncbi:alanine and proline-rich secreted protein Apa [[Mycobacterium] zoologicum]|uniref:alanine and proline-rich secreted protein Apa n=1 Tax=[Mycobacterium] zoologicum TaxID=2872311 RepID=UPI001CDA798A|nr:alanine and proline-rich secreted protein Apa [Mycolicibacter sp. MYC101]MEB3063743.1 alanine and proline-rich secreted protein Apa [Mycolicibacter sp. MYC101]
MTQVDLTSAAHRGFRAAASAAAIAGVLALVGAAPVYADPAPPTQPSPAGEAPAEEPITPPAGLIPLPPEAVAPEVGRVDDTAGGFSYVLPAGWVQSDTSHLEYGSSLLSKKTGESMLPGQPAPVANDTRIVLGKLDQRLYASAETDNAKAATRLGSDMGEFFMPFPGTRANQASAPLTGGGLTGSATYYEVKFTDPAKPVGQIWSGVIGVPPASGTGPQSERWFVVWLGTANNPVDAGAAIALAESIRPLAAPAAEPAPGTGPAPGGPAPAAPAPGDVAPAAPAPGGPVPDAGAAPAAAGAAPAAAPAA